MTKYNAEILERRFKGVASIRISQKKLGESKFANDAGYWTGGCCNWGGSHNLKEDCQVLAKFFTSITELRKARQDLMKFNNQQEFNRNKQQLLTKTEQAINGLNMKTGFSTSIAGVCCIWSDFAHFFEPIVNDFRSEVERLKRDIENVPYNEAKELQKILIQERNLQREIEENERRARNEPDENKRKQFVFLANEAKSKWKKLLERKKQLKTSCLGDDFNPDQHIDKFLQELEKKLTPKSRPSRTTPNPNQSSSSSSPSNSTDKNTSPNNSWSGYSPTANNEQKSFLEKYWKEILLSIGFLLAFYYFFQDEDTHQ